MRTGKAVARTTGIRKPLAAGAKRPDSASSETSFRRPSLTGTSALQQAVQAAQLARKAIDNERTKLIRGVQMAKIANRVEQLRKQTKNEDLDPKDRMAARAAAALSSFVQE